MPIQAVANDPELFEIVLPQGATQDQRTLKQQADRGAGDMMENRVSLPLRLPPFGRFLDALNAAGVQTRTARGFWGGVTTDGEVVVTAWTDGNDGDGRFYVWRPMTNHGGLKTQWEVGNIRVGTEVRLILLHQRGKAPIGGEARSIAAAALMPGKWRVVELPIGKTWHAVVEPLPDDLLSPGTQPPAATLAEKASPSAPAAAVAPASTPASPRIAAADRKLTPEGVERVRTAMNASGFKPGTTGKLMTALGFNRYDVSIGPTLGGLWPLKEQHLLALEKWLGDVEATY